MEKGWAKKYNLLEKGWAKKYNLLEKGWAKKYKLFISEASVEKQPFGKRLGQKIQAFYKRSKCGKATFWEKVVFISEASGERGVGRGE